MTNTLETPWAGTRLPVPDPHVCTGPPALASCALPPGRAAALSSLVAPWTAHRPLQVPALPVVTALPTLAPAPVVPVPRAAAAGPTTPAQPGAAPAVL